MTVPKIEQLVPHRGPISLLDAIEACGPEWVEAVARVAYDNPFAESGAIGAWVGIEYMAQAIAAYSGLESYSDGKSPRLGFLVGTRAYRSAVDKIALGTELRVRAERRFEAGNGLASFECSLRDTEGSLLAEATLTVFQPPDPAAADAGAVA